MGEFFKSWQRKAGCVLLAIAMIVTSAWMRSLNRIDAVDVDDANYLVSGHGCFVWATHSSCSVQLWHRAAAKNWFYGLLDPEPERDDQGGHVHNGFLCVWQHGIPGVYVGRDEFGDWTYNWLRIEYWAITTPLTLISAYLLIWPLRCPNTVNATVEKIRHTPTERHRPSATP